MSRRSFVGRAAATAGALTLPMGMAGRAFAQTASGPQTEFESNGGRAWTSFEGEQQFLADVVADAINPIDMGEIGMSWEERPLHLVKLGSSAAATVPTLYVVGSQHGNEPAGREACLKLIRDLAFTTDPALQALMQTTLVVVTPSANPDGRAQNRRTNADGVDINRDHLILATPEAQALARAFNEFQPYMVVDHHEYSGTPVRYDDDLTILWPRNLNVDKAVQDDARAFFYDYVRPDAEAAGYTADEYGMQKVGYTLFGQPLPMEDSGVLTSQTAGGKDEGIARNAFGLRHAMGILVESYVGTQPYRPSEIPSNMNRRVDSQRVCMDAELRFLKEQGDRVHVQAAEAGIRKAVEGAERSAPVFLDGADNEAPTRVIDPPPSGYVLDAAQLAEARQTMDLHGIDYTLLPDGGASVEMGQHAEPVIALLLDGRGDRHLVAATPQG